MTKPRHVKEPSKATPAASRSRSSLHITPAQPDPHRTLNRELSLINFNERVLASAEDPSVPLLERLRYLCIVSSNLDEIFEIRLSGLKAKIRNGLGDLPDADGYTPVWTVIQLQPRVQALVRRQYQLLNQQILPSLAREGVVIHTTHHFSPDQRVWAREYFLREAMPVLTPIGLDPSHPFPRILNKSLNFVVELKGRDAFGRKARIAIVQAPRILPRLIPVPSEVSGQPHGFMMLSSILQDNLAELFPGMEVQAIHQFRVTRNSDLLVEEEDMTDLREVLRGELSQRQYGDSVRLEVSESMSPKVRDLLLSEFELTEDDCYRVAGPVNLVRLMALPDLVDRPDLKFSTYHATMPVALSQQYPFDAIRQSDILVHHPYESFQSVTDFVRAAATDPKVVAISMTIYRTGENSVLMESLIEAVQAGKQVTAVVELMARFDEETNINWASRLEQAGAHVVFGVVGNKTHAKLCLIVRRDPDGLRRYLHLGTGNYQPRTAKLYEDFGLFTCDPDLCADVHDLLRSLTGLGRVQTMRKLWNAPFSLHGNVLRGIHRETEIARAGGKGHIMAKMNSLVEQEVIEALYEASQAGVEVDLVIRGICVLRPGVPGLSEKIRVRSTVGRFLEHSRIFYFRNEGEEQVYLSSADWMDRNFFRRVELAFPVENAALRRRVIEEGFRVHLQDNTSSWSMDGEGSYSVRRRRGATRKAAQEILMNKSRTS